MDRQTRGRWAEEAAARELQRRGFEILERNVFLQRGELDIVARRDHRLWFVETKCRSRIDRGAPHRAIDRRKRAALFAAAREYLVRKDFRGEYGFLAASVIPAPRDGRPCVELCFLPISPSDGCLEL